MTVYATLCFILRGSKTLLLRKSTGLFGGGKWNAPGGKIRQSEDAKDCAIRETLEETGLTVKNLEKVGVLFFYKNRQREVPDWIVHVFLTQEFEGTAAGGREGVLKWFDVESLPYEEMWEDDRFWCRRALDRGGFEGSFYFSGDFEKLIDYKVEAKPALAH